MKNKLILPLIFALGLGLNCNRNEKFYALNENYASIEAIDAQSKNPALDFEKIKVIDVYSEITRTIKQGRQQHHFNLDSSFVLYHLALEKMKDIENSGFDKVKKKNLKNIYGLIYHLLGDFHYAKGNKKGAFFYYNQALYEFEKIGYKQGIEKIDLKELFPTN
jgi:hypothetical protein